MTVGELRVLLEGVDDDVTVYIGDGNGFDIPDIEVSGLSEFGPLCDKDGNELPEEEQPEPEQIFILTSGDGLEIK